VVLSIAEGLMVLINVEGESSPSIWCYHIGCRIESGMTIGKVDFSLKNSSDKPLFRKHQWINNLLYIF
jgi:hypothetical protein